MGAHERADIDVAAEADRLIEESRSTCLWFLRPDYHPTTDAERVRLLEQIERRGDLEAYRRAATLRRWLSRNPSVASAGS
jgi:hypothetical protein